MIDKKQHDIIDMIDKIKILIDMIDMIDKIKIST